MSRRGLLYVLLLAAVVYGLVSMQHSAFGRFSLGSLSLSLAAPPAPASAASASGILGRPSLSADFINQVLSAYHSSAAGLGQALYDDSVRYGIDDAYPLGFFLHESSMGTLGVAPLTHSLGNIRCTAGWSSCYQGYRSYANWQDGFLDWFHLISSQYLPQHLTTLETIIPVYAPASENNVAAYIAAVRSAVLAWRSGRVVV